MFHVKMLVGGEVMPGTVIVTNISCAGDPDGHTELSLEYQDKSAKVVLPLDDTTLDRLIETLIRARKTAKDEAVLRDIEMIDDRMLRYAR